MLNGLDLFRMKTCENCNIELTRKRKPSGKLEANTSLAKRRFCSYKCRGNFTASKNECLESSVRQRVLKLFPKQTLTQCAVCGDKGKPIHRHHIDKNPYNNIKENILICCQNCHVKEHQKSGFWGKGKKERICIACNRSFSHENRKRKTCSNYCFLKICSSKAKERWECGSH